LLKSLSKNKLKFYQKLNQKKFRDQENLYLISGSRGVESVLKNDAGNCIEIIIDETKKDFISNFDNYQQTEISIVSTKEFQALNDEINPQGICVVAKKPSTVLDMSDVNEGQIIFLDRINDPGNLGTILRSAAWFGIKTILLSPNSADPFQPKVVRSSVGAINSVEIFENVGLQELERIKLEKGYKLWATDVTNGRNLSTIIFDLKTLFMFGSEAHGLTEEYVNICDEKIMIQKTGIGESLNLANAVSIVMYQAMLSN